MTKGTGKSDLSSTRECTDGISGTSTSQNLSSASDAQLNDSKKYWRKPTNVTEFAAQVNEVATKVLNGDIDLESARIYSGLARVVAQSVSVQVTRARFLKEVPDLSLTKEEE